MLCRSVYRLVWTTWVLCGQFGHLWQDLETLGSHYTTGLIMLTNPCTMLDLWEKTALPRDRRRLWIEGCVIDVDQNLRNFRSNLSKQEQLQNIFFWQPEKKANVFESDKSGLQDHELRAGRQHLPCVSVQHLCGGDYILWNVHVSIEMVRVASRTLQFKKRPQKYQVQGCLCTAPQGKLNGNKYPVYFKAATKTPSKLQFTTSKARSTLKSSINFFYFIFNEGCQIRVVSDNFDSLSDIMW